MRTFVGYLLLLFAGAFRAQEFRSGLVLGGGYPTIVDAHSIVRPFKYLFNAGAHFQLQTNKTLSLNANLLLHRRVYRVPVPLTDNTGVHVGTIIARQRMDICSIPVYLGWSFGSKKQFFFNAGFYINYLLRQQLFLRGIYGNNKNEVFTTYRGKMSDTGFLMGIGRNIKLSEMVQLNFELRAQQGIALNVFSTRFLGDIMIISGFTFRTSRSKSDN